MDKNDEIDDPGKLIYTGDINDNDSTEDPVVEIESYEITEDNLCIIEEVYGPPDEWWKYDIAVEYGGPADWDEMDIKEIRNDNDQIIFSEDSDISIE